MMREESACLHSFPEEASSGVAQACEYKVSDISKLEI